MVAGMRSYLSAIGVDVVNETVKARLVLSSENVLLPDGGFDVELMLKKLEDTLDQALNDGHKGLWATGDMTWEFGSEKNLDKLMEYELRLEELMRRREGLSGICQYHRNSLTREAIRQGLLTHRTFFINETLSRINPLFIPFRLPEDPPPTNLELDEAVTALCQVKKAKS